MDTPVQRHPAEHGLMDSGYVVSVVRSAADVRTQILGEGYFIGVTLPGNPCDVLVCLSAAGGQEQQQRVHAERVITPHAPAGATAKTDSPPRVSPYVAGKSSTSRASNVAPLANLAPIRGMEE